jgi:short chain dehydrogenase
MDVISRGPMVGKTVLITGSTGGIGQATALGLATMGAHVAITGRDQARTENAAREIRAIGGGQVDTFVADLSCQSQVRRLADEVLQQLPRIDVLVNNVEGYWNTRHVTADGLERTFALNHLAPFLLSPIPRICDRIRLEGRIDLRLGRGRSKDRTSRPGHLGVRAVPEAGVHIPHVHGRAGRTRRAQRGHRHPRVP